MYTIFFNPNRKNKTKTENQIDDQNGNKPKPLLCAVKFRNKMLYLVNCEVVKSFYMDDTKKSEVNHIVEAETEQEAMDKVQEFYSKKDNEYHVSHWVNFNYCNEVIS